MPRRHRGVFVPRVQTGTPFETRIPLRSVVLMIVRRLVPLTMSLPPLDTCSLPIYIVARARRSVL